MGGVGGGVLLDSDLGDMVDLVVDLVTNMVDSWGGNVVVGNRGDSNSRGGLDLDSLDSSNSRSGNMVGSRSYSNCSSGGNTSVVHHLAGHVRKQGPGHLHQLQGQHSYRQQGRGQPKAS